MKYRSVSVVLAVSAMVLAAYLWRPGAPSISENASPRPLAASAMETPETGFAEASEAIPAMPPEMDATVDTSTAAQMPAEPPSESTFDESFAASIKSMDEPADVEFPEDRDAEDSVDPAEQMTLDQTATTDTSLRNADYPRTYISAIEVDLESPNHWVRLTWSGPEADRQETGPFHSSPGRGLGNNDCDDVEESNRTDSNCTPKGKMSVEGFSNSMPTYSHCRFVTWFLISRGIAFHSYPDVPNYPASHGCVRLDKHAAQLIHNNSKIGETEVTVDGTWTFGQ